jgi:hypothetical protein
VQCIQKKFIEGKNFLVVEELLIGVHYRLSNVSQGQFANLEKLQTILLTGNSIQDIEPQVP